jgi:[methyl-Co(III) methanol-specific corrinoid protein]:coenzyme M methyltransferase
MDWGGPERLPVYTSHPWQDIEEAKIPGDLLDRAPISTYLEGLRIAKHRFGEKIAILGKVMGPFSMVQVMCGVENVMLGLVDNPERIRQFLDICTSVLVRCANSQFEAGADALAIGEGGAGANMLSPQMYEEYLLEVHRRMIAEIEGPTIMHICGDITPRLDSFRRIGLHCFNFDWAIEPSLMKRHSVSSFRIMGNVNTTDLLTGSPQAIRKQVFENLDAGVDIISPGCAISPLCPSENIKAMSEAILAWEDIR